MRDLFKKYVYFFTFLSLAIFCMVAVTEHYLEQYLIESGIKRMTHATKQALIHLLPSRPIAAQRILQSLQNEQQDTIVLQRVSTLLLTKKEKNILRTHRVFWEKNNSAHNGLTYRYYLWPKSDYALVMPIRNHRRLMVADFIYPYFTLVRNLVKQAKNQKQTLRQISKAFHFPFEVQPISLLELTRKERKLIHSRSWLHYTLSDQFQHQEVLYAKLSNDMVLKMGPLTWPINDETHDLLMFFLLLSLLWIMAFFSCYKMYSSIQKLVTTTHACASGRFPVQSQLKRSSILYEVDQALIKMSQDLQTIMRNQHVLMQSLTHDIKTPLMRLKFHLLDVVAKKQTDTIEQMHGDIDDIEDLIESILLYTNNFKQRPEPHLVPIILAPWLEQQVQPYQSTSPVLIRVACPDDVVLEMDPFLMARAFQNLMENALRHVHKSLLIQVCAYPEALILTIKNDIKKRVECSRGWNMGLVIVDNIMKCHHGTLDIAQDTDQFVAICTFKQDS